MFRSWPRSGLGGIPALAREDREAHLIELLHLDRIDRRAPLSFEEARSDLRGHVTPSVMDDYENDQLHDVGAGFIRNWNRHFRTYLAQADSPMDMDSQRNMQK